MPDEINEARPYGERSEFEVAGESFPSALAGNIVRGPTAIASSSARGNEGEPSDSSDRKMEPSPERPLRL